MRVWREPAAIVAAGVLVALAPFAWYGMVWPDPVLPTTDYSAVAAAAAFALPPYVLLAALRRAAVVSLVGATIALLAASVAVVLLQYVSIDPTDTSSTQAVGLPFETFWGCAAVALIAGVDWIARAVFRS